MTGTARELNAARFHAKPTHSTPKLRWPCGSPRIRATSRRTSPLELGNGSGSRSPATPSSPRQVTMSEAVSVQHSWCQQRSGGSSVHSIHRVRRKPVRPKRPAHARQARRTAYFSRQTRQGARCGKTCVSSFAGLKPRALPSSRHRGITESCATASHSARQTACRSCCRSPLTRPVGAERQSSSCGNLASTRSPSATAADRRRLDRGRSFAR